jgi:hypothetical protein
MAKEYDVDLVTQALPTPTAKSLEALNNSFVKLEDMGRPPAKICIFGDQGTGKTKATMEFLQAITPEDKLIAYVDSAEGWSTLQNHPHLKRRVIRMAYENPEQLLILAGAIRGKVGKYAQIGAICLDEYSSMIKSDKTWIVKARSQQALKKGEFRDPYMPQRPDYLASQIRSEEVVNAFLSCGIHVGFTSHEKLDEKTIMTRPDFAPGAANDFQRLIHSVIRVTKKMDKTSGKVTFSFQLQPIGNRVSVKNRIGGLGNFIEDIGDLSKAYEQWGGEDSPQPDNSQLTEEQTTEIAQDDELLRLLNAESKES